MRCWESPPRLPVAATPPAEGIFRSEGDTSLPNPTLETFLGMQI